VAEQVGSDCQAVVASLVAIGADADQRGLIGEERQLERLGHRVVRGVWVGFTDKCITSHRFAARRLAGAEEMGGAGLAAINRGGSGPWDM
jgi:hypothetical protein